MGTEGWLLQGGLCATRVNLLLVSAPPRSRLPTVSIAFPRESPQGKKEGWVRALMSQLSLGYGWYAISLLFFPSWISQMHSTVQGVSSTPVTQALFTAGSETTATIPFPGCSCALVHRPRKLVNRVSRDTQGVTLVIRVNHPFPSLLVSWHKESPVNRRQIKLQPKQGSNAMARRSSRASRVREPNHVCGEGSSCMSSVGPWDGIPGPQDCMSCGLSSWGTGGLRQCYSRAHADSLHAPEPSGHAAAHFRQAGEGVHASKTGPPHQLHRCPSQDGGWGEERNPPATIEATSYHRGSKPDCDWAGWTLSWRSSEASFPVGPHTTPSPLGAHCTCTEVVSDRG